MTILEPQKEKNIRTALSKMKIDGEDMDYAISAYLAIVYDGVKEVPKVGNRYIPQRNLERKMSELMREKYHYKKPIDNRVKSAFDSLWRCGAIIPIETGSTDPDIFISTRGPIKTGSTDPDIFISTRGRAKSWIAVHPAMLDLIGKEERSLDFAKTSFSFFNSKIDPPANKPDLNYWFRVHGECSISSMTYFKSVALIILSSVYEAFFFDVDVRKIAVNVFTRTDRIKRETDSFLSPLVNVNDPDSPDIDYNFYAGSAMPSNEISSLSGIIKLWSIEVYRKRSPKDVHFGGVITPFHPGSMDEKLYSTVFYLQRPEFLKFCEEFFQRLR
jgi:hypothetical protein